MQKHTNTASQSEHSASLIDLQKYKEKIKEPAGFARVRIPGSKSISNRAILLASLAKGRSHLHGVLFAEDTAWMINICRQLGAKIDVMTDKSLVIEGVNGCFQAAKEDLYVGNAGTCARFLCAVLAQAGQGDYVLRGNPRMHMRPMHDLIEALRILGADIRCLEQEGFLPLRITSNKNSIGGKVKVRANMSSQFVSALLMLAPLTHSGMEVEVVGDFVSEPYADMTATMMHDFGITFDVSKKPVYTINGGQNYQGREYTIPGDASSASYFFALAAMTGMKIKVEGLRELPVQSDLGFVHILKHMGAETLFEDESVTVRGHPKELTGLAVDMRNMSDLVPTLAVLALFAKGETRIQHVAHIRIKESDRIAVLATELRKFGAQITEYDNGLIIRGPETIKNKEYKICTHDDHRIAMAFAILSKKIPGVVLDDPSCVHKTYPRFFEDLESCIQQGKLNDSEYRL